MSIANFETAFNILDSRTANGIYVRFLGECSSKLAIYKKRDWHYGTTESFREISAANAELNTYFVLNGRGTRGKFHAAEDIDSYLWLGLDFDGNLRDYPRAIEELKCVQLCTQTSDRDGVKSYQLLIPLENLPISIRPTLAAICKGTGSDDVSDPARILRLPGFMNHGSNSKGPGGIASVMHQQFTDPLGEDELLEVLDIVNKSEFFRGMAAAKQTRLSIAPGLELSPTESIEHYRAIYSAGAIDIKGQRNSWLTAFISSQETRGIEVREIMSLAEELNAKLFKDPLPLREVASMQKHLERCRSRREEGLAAMLDEYAVEEADGRELAPEPQKIVEKTESKDVAPGDVESAFFETAIPRLIVLLNNARGGSYGDETEMAREILRAMRNAGVARGEFGSRVCELDVPWGESRYVIPMAKAELRALVLKLLTGIRVRALDGHKFKSEVSEHPSIKTLLRQKGATAISLTLVRQRVLDAVVSMLASYLITEPTAGREPGPLKIVFQNGVYDLVSGEFKKDGLAFSRYANPVAVPYVAGEVAELGGTGEFGRFLDGVFPGDQAAHELVGCILAYCACSSPSLQKFFIFEGVSGAGKSTLASIFSTLIGGTEAILGGEGRAVSLNTVALDYNRIAERFGLSGIDGKLLGIIDEPNCPRDERTHNAVFDVLKRLSSGGAIEVERKMVDSYSIIPKAKILITANKPLEFDDTQGSGERRICALKFSVPYRGSDASDEFPRRVCQEGAAILSHSARMFSGLYKRLGRQLFERTDSAAYREGMATARDAMNPVARCLEGIVIPAGEGGLLGESANAIPVAVLISICQGQMSKEERVRFPGKKLKAAIHDELSLKYGAGLVKVRPARERAPFDAYSPVVLDIPNLVDKVSLEALAECPVGPLEFLRVRYGLAISTPGDDF